MCVSFNILTYLELEIGQTCANKNDCLDAVLFRFGSFKIYLIYSYVLQELA